MVDSVDEDQTVLEYHSSILDLQYLLLCNILSKILKMFCILELNKSGKAESVVRRTG